MGQFKLFVLIIIILEGCGSESKPKPISEKELQRQSIIAKKEELKSSEKTVADNKDVVSLSIDKNDGVSSKPINKITNTQPGLSGSQNSINISNPIACGEEMPQYPGGTEEMIKFIKNNLHYPEAAIKQKIEGKVYVKFVVDVTGELKDIKVKKGIGGGCDEEAVRVIKIMPKWKPGKQFGKIVAVNLVLPISFNLNSDNIKK
ncbi:MAG: TonB family protein [Bacteroidales bacterium]|nr:TonB family protein [Bacteroidales bacterium]